MVHKKYGLLPEAFTTDMDIYWPYHLIRPELVESTYHLYKSTLDPYYLHVGAELLESIERYSRVPCGFAAIEVDVLDMMTAIEKSGHTFSEPAILCRE